ncbi:MAG: DUF1489 domain-containing protein [Rickettsiales bacterium]
MTMHLIKLSVGPESLADLERWQRGRLRQGDELMHITRHMPKRADEVLAGGSIYWVIKGWLVARQRLLELRPLVRDGQSFCGLIYDKEMVRVSPRQHRAFQGWRYFDPKDAPPDIKKGSKSIPEDLQRELASLGLL